MSSWFTLCTSYNDTCQGWSDKKCHSYDHNNNNTLFVSSWRYIMYKLLYSKKLISIVVKRGSQLLKNSKLRLIELSSCGQTGLLKFCYLIYKWKMWTQVRSKLEWKGHCYNYYETIMKLYCIHSIKPRGAYLIFVLFGVGQGLFRGRYQLLHSEWGGKFSPVMTSYFSNLHWDQWKSR